MDRGSDLVDDQVAGLVDRIYKVQPNRTMYNVVFVPFEPEMAPRSPAVTSIQKEAEDWRTLADARLGLFYRADVAVTPHDALSGQELEFRSLYVAARVGEGGRYARWAMRDGVVFFTSTAEYEVLTADLEQFLEAHSDKHSENRALDLAGQAVIDFLVDRLQTSRLVPHELPAELGLERTLSANRKPVAVRNFSIQVTDMSKVQWDLVAAVAGGIVEVDLGGAIEIIFIPFESAMAPPFPADVIAREAYDDVWDTPAEARVDMFYGASFVVTPYNPLAGRELNFTALRRTYHDICGNEMWEPGSGVVFYISTDQFKLLTADLLSFVKTHSTRNDTERALDLRHRPVIDFLVDRLQTSRLVPEELLHRLGLERTPLAAEALVGERDRFVPWPRSSIS